MSVRTVVFTFGAILLLAETLTAAEYLRNPGFTRLLPKGTPADWELRDTATGKEHSSRPADRPAASVKDGVLTLDPADSRFEVMLIHGNTPLKGSKNYTFSFQVKGSGNASYRAVSAWTTIDPASGKPAWKNTNGAWLSAPGEWRNINVSIPLPADARTAYVYLAATGSGKVDFKNVRLRDAGVDLTAVNELAVFSPGEPIEYLVDNQLNAANRIDYAVTDFYGQAVTAGKLAAGNNLKLPAMPNGYYEIAVSETDRNGQVVATRKRTFAVIPEVPDTVRNASENPFGAMVNPNTAYPMSERERDAKYMHRIGVNFVRTHRLNWVHVQRDAKAPWDWKASDDEVAMYKRYGLHLIATTGWSTPNWASSGFGKPASGLSLGNLFPAEAYLPELDKFYEALGKRYRGKVDYYEIGNEVDASNFWMGRYENAVKGDQAAILNDYFDLFVRLAKAIRKGDPDAKIGPNLTGRAPLGYTYKPWMDRFYESGAAREMDYFSTHYLADMDAIRQNMRKHGKEVDIIFTEIGGLIPTESKKRDTPENLRKIIKITYFHFATEYNKGARALCKFLLREIQGVDEGWIAGMLDVDFSIRPEYVAYATMIRKIGGAAPVKELNITRAGSAGWVQGFAFSRQGKPVNIILFNDAAKGLVTLKTPDASVRVTDVMGREGTIKPENGEIKLAMELDLPLIVEGRIIDEPGPVKHPEPVVVSERKLGLLNGGFELAPSNGKIPGWGMLLDEMAGTGDNRKNFTVTLDQTVKTAGKAALCMSAPEKTEWYGVATKLPMNEIPVPKLGEYVTFDIKYKQKGENLVGIGSGLTLAFRDANMRRVSFGNANWMTGSFDWTPKEATLKYDRFHPDTKIITLEFYIGKATGKVWLDDVEVTVRLWRKSIGAADYQN